jgi:polyhydroxyalkanoate synthesis regulator phasin
MPIEFSQPGAYNSGVAQQYGALQQQNLDREFQLKQAALQQRGGGGYAQQPGGDGGGGGGGGGRGAQQVYDDSRLNQAEELRLNQLNQGMAGIDEAIDNGSINEQEANDMRLMIQTRQHPLEMRRQRAQEAMQNAQLTAFMNQQAMQAATRQQNMAFDAEHMENGVGSIPDRIMQRQVREEVMAANPHLLESAQSPEEYAAHQAEIERLTEDELHARGGITQYTRNGNGEMVPVVRQGQAGARNSAGSSGTRQPAPTQEDGSPQPTLQQISHTIDVIKKEMDDELKPRPDETAAQTAARRPSWLRDLPANFATPQAEGVLREAELVRRVRERLGTVRAALQTNAPPTPPRRSLASTRIPPPSAGGGFGSRLNEMADNPDQQQEAAPDQQQDPVAAQRQDALQRIDAMAQPAVAPRTAPGGEAATPQGDAGAGQRAELHARNSRVIDALVQHGFMNPWLTRTRFQNRFEAEQFWANASPAQRQRAMTQLGIGR